MSSHVGPSPARPRQGLSAAIKTKPHRARVLAPDRALHPDQAPRHDQQIQLEAVLLGKPRGTLVLMVTLDLLAPVAPATPLSQDQLPVRYS